jgi:TM2 domain containing protein
MNKIILTDKFKVDSYLVKTYLTKNGKNFSEISIKEIKQRLYNLTQEEFNEIQSVRIRNTTTMFILSFFLGFYGIDRFLLKQFVLGILKLSTFGGCGIWWFIDLFFVIDETKKMNSQKILLALSNKSVYSKSSLKRN